MFTERFMFMKYLDSWKNLTFTKRFEIQGKIDVHGKD